MPARGVEQGQNEIYRNDCGFNCRLLLGLIHLRYPSFEANMTFNPEPGGSISTGAVLFVYLEAKLNVHH